MKKVTAVLFLLMAPLASAVIISYDFEVGEGYVTGPLSGQNLWEVTVGIPDQPIIDDSAPSSGMQHARINRDSTAQAGQLSAAISPTIGFQDIDKSPSVHIDLYFSDLNGAAYDVIAQSDRQQLITWRLRFTNTGDLLIYDSPLGMNQFVDIGYQYPVGTYFNLYVETKTQENEINYYVDGTLIYTAVAGVAFGQSIEQMVVLSNNLHANDDEFMLFDNIILNTENVDLIFANSFETVD